MSKSNYYLVRPYPNEVNRIDDFKKLGCIGIGWSDLGTVSGMCEAELRAALKTYLSTSNEKKLRSTLGTFKIFCMDLKKGDFIIAPENKMGPIHVAQITSDYYYDVNAVDLDFAHQRKAEWLGETFSREVIAALNNSRLVGALKFPGTAANLQEYSAELSILLGTKPMDNIQTSTANTVQFMTASYPLSSNICCNVSFPTDMTAAEAQRFATFISTLSFDTPTNSN